MRREGAEGVIVVEEVADRGFEYLSGEDMQTCGTIHSAIRRNEWLSWRNIVRREVGRCTLNYTPQGAPLIVDPEGKVAFLSVSHTRRSVAVFLSKTPCGIDIESAERNFDRVAKRYIAPEEELLAAALGDDFKAIVWCAKEALFKWGGRSGVDFLHDVRLTEAPTKGQIEALYFGQPTPLLHYETIGREILCYING
ncbi:MAG: 4'-phosphopantetheinyl transferase superfamily protein [Tidjanibacter sp.]|nr:4'-phosphopantetheinyl transferase superfamily protein [Tidjanibacter sp.]